MSDQLSSPQFGRHFDLPEVNDNVTPPREWSMRQGFGKKHLDSQEHVAGQGYLFRARDEYEKAGDLHDERSRINREHAERQGAVQAAHRSTMGFDGPIEKAAPASWWPKPDQQIQHGEYTVAHFPEMQGVAAFHGDQPVARLQMPRMSRSAMDNRRVVGFVQTAPEHQRRGVAAAMYHLGQQATGGNLLHDVARTPAGNAFAKAVGGKNMLGQDMADDHTWDRR